MTFTWGLKKRLLVSLLLVSLIPIVVIVSVISRNYSALAERQIAEASANTLDRTTLKLNNLLEEIQRVSEYLTFQPASSSDTILSFLLQYRQGQAVEQNERLRNARDFRAATESYLLNHHYLEGIYLFAEDGTVFSHTKGSELVEGYKPFEDEWYAKTIELGGKLYASNVAIHPFLLSQSPSLTFSRTLYDPATRNKIGVLLINCNLRLFDDLLAEQLPGQQIMIVNDQLSPIFGKDNSLLAELHKQEGQLIVPKQSDGNIHAFNTFSEYKWHIIVSVSTAAVTGQIAATMTFALWFGIAWAILATLLSLWIAGTFSKPISQMAQMMRRHEAEPLPELPIPENIRRYEERVDEIGVLYKRYFNMLQETRTLIREKYQNRLIAMSSKMKALEAQINSHFLFNTLTTINSIAELEEVESIAIISKSLGDMFRYSIKQQGDLVLLAAEIEHISNYMNIQSFRYGSKLSWSTAIEPELERQTVLKLILQPLVENAVYHGLELKKGGGHVSVHGFTTETGIRLEVRDDGIGIDEQKLEQLQAMLASPPALEQLTIEEGDSRSDNRSIGLYNVHARIALYYGTDYGLDISSSKNQGTTIGIRLPHHHQDRTTSGGE